LIDTRTYQQLVDETLARVPIHTPEWTNFNSADPGVTIVQLFAFLTENLLYRANQIPERNRAKFLNLLGVGLRPASEAKGLATISNLRGALDVETLPADLELRAGNMPFRTTLGLGVLPIEARLFTKRQIQNPAAELVDYYRLLYASYDADLPTNFLLYGTVPFDSSQGVLDLSDTVDRSLWIALLGRPDDRGDPDDPWRLVRDKLANRVLSLGLAPAVDVEQLTLAPGGAPPLPANLLAYEMPQVGVDRTLLFDAAGWPDARYRPLEARADFDPLTQPGVVQITLPGADELTLWRNIDPLEAGIGDLPPMIDDSALAGRLVTWLRVRASGGARVRLRWAGINAVPIRQYERVLAERLADGDGTPEQSRRLARAPVLKGTITIETVVDGRSQRWTEIDDLLAAGPEVPIAGASPTSAPVDCFVADHEAGIVRFGDGFAGRRPSAEARIYTSYGYSEGAEGNIGAGAIQGGPLLPGGYVATNPLPTWGGADAETVANGEKQVRRMLQHRDRLVTAEDFVSIAWRAPGVAIGRIEVLPAWHPDLAPAAIGSAAGVVTLLAIPSDDITHPDAPRANRPFLDALCRYLDPRRLLTTELVLRGPNYKGIWISVGIEVAAGKSIAETTEAVRHRLRAFLSPLPESGAGFASQQGQLYGPPVDPAKRGWPLNQSVNARVLLAEAARVAGVIAVAEVVLAETGKPPVASVSITGIELPEILGISVVAGDPIDLAALRGDRAPDGPTIPALAVPVVAETC